MFASLTDFFKDHYESVEENFRQKTTNPFIGTLILVYVFHNWQMFYSLFNFDDKMNLDDKIRIIGQYFTSSISWQMLGIYLKWSFGILIGTYLLMNLSLFIVNLFKFRITPIIYKLSAKRSTIENYLFVELEKKYNDLQKKYDNDIKSRIDVQNQIQSENDRLTSDNKELKNQNRSYAESARDLHVKLAEIKNDKEKYEKENVDLNKFRNDANEMIKGLQSENRLLKNIDSTSIIKINSLNEIKDEMKNRINMLMNDLSTNNNFISELRIHPDNLMKLIDLLNKILLIDSEINNKYAKKERSNNVTYELVKDQSKLNGYISTMIVKVKDDNKIQEEGKE